MDAKSILNYIGRIRKTHGDDIEIITGYEAGCLGYSLYKDLDKAGMKCIIIALATLSKQKTGEIKPINGMPRKSQELLVLVHIYLFS